MGESQKLVIHHGGIWRTENGNLHYVGGKVTKHKYESGKFDLDDFKAIISSLGHNDIIKMHYFDPRKELCDGMRYLGFDNATFYPFPCLLMEFRVIHIYTEHEIVARDISQDTMSFMDLLFENDINEMHFGVNLSTAVNANDVDFDENGSDNNDDEIINVRNIIEEEKGQQNLYNNELLMLQKLAERHGTDLNLDSDFDGDNSDYESPNESSDEEDCGYFIPPEPLRRNVSKKKVFIDGTMLNEAVFFVGQEFESPPHFRKALIDYCVHHGKDVDYKKNDKTRIVADCKVNGYPWKIRASWDGRNRTFKVKTHNPNHTCGRSSKVKKINASWIAVNYYKSLRLTLI
ncbi:Acetyl-CoA carboxylase 2 [Bienertia sinuspersici]